MDGLFIGVAGEKGDKGDPGERGTKWWYGNGLPAPPPDAIEGDFYMDVETGKVYELRLS